jgi:hypothetical protein
LLHLKTVAEHASSNAAPSLSSVATGAMTLTSTRVTEAVEIAASASVKALAPSPLSEAMASFLRSTVR